jgi:hypothetical protein
LPARGPAVANSPGRGVRAALQQQRDQPAALAGGRDDQRRVAIRITDLQPGALGQGEVGQLRVVALGRLEQRAIGDAG